MIIHIRSVGVKEASANLPEAAQIKRRITQAIRATIREGKQEGGQLVEKRYTARSMLRLGKVTARAAGMTGKLTISGRRNLIKKFKLSPASRPPHNPAGGLRVQVVRGQGGMLPHAFVNRRGIVFERAGKARLPLRHLNTVSLPGAFERIGDKLTTSMASRLQSRLEAIL